MPRPKSRARKELDAKSRPFVTPHDHAQLKWKLVKRLSRPALETIVAGILEQLEMAADGPNAEHLFVPADSMVRSTVDAVQELRVLLRNMQVLPQELLELRRSASKQSVDTAVLAALDRLSGRCRCRK